MTKQPPIATDAQIEAIRAQRYAHDEHILGIAANGIRLTWDQEEAVGEAAWRWLADRFGLRVTTDCDGISFYPAHSGQEG